MSQNLIFAKDGNGGNAYAPEVSSDMSSVQIPANGNATLTLPTNSPWWCVVFSYPVGSEIFVAYNGTASGPAGNTFQSTNSERNPAQRKVPSTQSNGSPTTINVLNNGASSINLWVGLYAVT